MPITEKINDIVLYNYGIKRLVRSLLKNRVLVGCPPYRYIYNKKMARAMSLFSKRPFRVMMENTNMCDADCSFCPHKGMKRPVGVMELALSKKITDECARFGIDYLTIYGFGEPFLDKYFFERIGYAKSKGIKRVTTNTNAAELDNDKNRLLVEGGGIDEVYISFDAATAETYKKIRPNLDFERVKKNIVGLIEARNLTGRKRPLIILSFVESPLNTKDVSEYLRFWRKRADFVSISSAHNWTGDIPIRGVDDESLRGPCRLPWTDMFILFNGDVTLCCNDYEGRAIIGNINNSSIEDIWAGPALARLRECHVKRLFNNINICSKCNYNYHFKSNWWVSK